MCAETRGKTLHLLKKQAKPVPQMRKRVKRDIYASPRDFQRLHPDFEEQKAEEAEMQVEVELRRDLGYVPAEGGPNQIGNAEDGPVVPDNVAAEQYPGTPSYPDGGGDEIMYQPVTPKRTEAQVARMASRRGKSKERPPQQ